MTYRIRSPHAGLPEMKQVMTYVSFDPGQNNFVIRIEKRVGSIVGSTCTRIQTLVQDKHVISYESKTYWMLTLHEVLRTYSKYWSSVDIALIEAQMHDNTRMKCMEAALISYFVLEHPDITVIELSPKLKGRMLSGKKMKSRELKQWSPTVASDLCKIRKDVKYAEILASREVQTKQDDDADTLIQIEAFCMFVGYKTTVKYT